ncbi:hypothetical protein, partial [Streptomyces sp. GbtcB6]|uniref:hypothetical protein n=1 Tax=Streptomyces sp. GbtcB6 TaxID=2824751 RepID=UPI001C3003F4
DTSRPRFGRPRRGAGASPTGHCQAEEPGRRRRVRPRRLRYVCEMTYADDHQEHEQLRGDPSCKRCHAVLARAVDRSTAAHL